MGRRGKQRKAEDIMQPTIEQMRAGDYQPAAVMHVETARASRAYRRRPVIDVMLEAGQISQEQYDRLAYYGDQAALADKSPVRSCCDNSPRSGNGPGVTILSAMIETGRIERELAAHGLLSIARAVVVDNQTLAQWCIAQHGGRERYNGRGEFVAIVPIAEKRNIEIALRALRYAAGVITR